MLNDFVDKVFVVNLPERTDRLKEVMAELEKFGIVFEVWAAIKNENGAIGLVSTMEQLLLHCINKKYNRVCVFEDDVSIIRENFNELIEKGIRQLPEKFHLLYLGGNLHKHPSRVSGNILLTTSIYSTHAVIYSKEAIEYIHPRLTHTLAYDTLLVNTIQKENRCYCVFPLLVSQKTGYSDIQGKVVDYKKFIEKKYNEKTMNL